MKLTMGRIRSALDSLNALQNTHILDTECISQTPLSHLQSLDYFSCPSAPNHIFTNIKDSQFQVNKHIQKTC